MEKDTDKCQLKNVTATCVCKYMLNIHTSSLSLATR